MADELNLTDAQTEAAIDLAVRITEFLDEYFEWEVGDLTAPWHSELSEGVTDVIFRETARQASEKEGATDGQ